MVSIRSPAFKSLCRAFLENSNLKFKGNVSVSGVFDQHSADIFFQTHGFELENELFIINVNSLALDESKQPSGYPGSYHFDFDNDHFSGKMPIENGSYLDKQTGLYFHEVRTDIEHVAGTLQSEAIEAFVDGIYVAGSGVFDYAKADQGIYDLKIHHQIVSGKFAEIKTILDRLGNFFFSGFAIQGNVEYRKDGGQFHFAWTPKGCLVEAIVNGTLNEGSMVSEDFDLGLHDLFLNFSYNHQASELRISDIQGTLLVGKPDQLEEYILAGEQIYFTNFAKDDAVFDVWIGDRQRDVVRVAGKTKRSVVHPGMIDIEFNSQLSHVGPVHPVAMNLLLKDWSQVEQFHLKMALSIENILFDLQRLSKTGLLGLSKGFNESLLDLKSAKGHLDVDLRYDGTPQDFSFQVIGENLVFPETKFDTLMLVGKKQKGNWSIEQFQLDRLSLSADMVKADDHFDIHFFGFRFGQSLLTGMDGKFFPDDNRLLANLNLVEIDLEKLDEFADFVPFVEQHHPKGELRANGKMELNFTSEQGWQADARLKASLRHFETDGLAFEDAEQVSCRFLSHQGIVIEGLKTTIKQDDRKKFPISFSMDKGGYDFSSKRMWIEKLDFLVPSKKLGWVAKIIDEKFPGATPRQFTELLSQSKKAEDLKGYLKLDVRPDFHDLQLNLADGTYEWNDQKHELKSICLDFSKEGMKLKGCSHLPLQWMAFDIQCNPDLSNGTCSLTLPEISKEQTLTINWLKSSDSMEISNIEGSLCGLELALTKPLQLEKAERWAMKGKASIQPLQLSRWLPGKEMLSLLQNWKADRQVDMEGSWEMDKAHWDRLWFKGNVNCKNFVFKEFDLDSLSAEVEASPESIVLTNFIVEDTAGTILGDRLVFNKNDSHWSFNAPL